VKVAREGRLSGCYSRQRSKQNAEQHLRRRLSRRIAVSIDPRDTGEGKIVTQSRARARTSRVGRFFFFLFPTLLFPFYPIYAHARAILRHREEDVGNLARHARKPRSRFRGIVKLGEADTKSAARAGGGGGRGEGRVEIECENTRLCGSIAPGGRGTKRAFCRTQISNLRIFKIRGI